MTGAADTAGARQADTLLVHGKVLPLDGGASVHEALAVRGGRIAAVGRSDEIRTLAGPGVRVIDVEGRTVIPGLIDSHIHAIRAALSFATEVHWIGTRSIPAALDRIRAAARRAPPIGTALRGPEETPTGEEALRFFARGSAWCAHDEARRGSLEVGRMADLAVLSGDYASGPVEEIGGIESLLTMVGGRIVHAAGALERPLDAGPPLR